jgi:hypothetical protein
MIMKDQEDLTSGIGGNMRVEFWAYQTEFSQWSIIREDTDDYGETKSQTIADNVPSEYVFKMVRFLNAFVTPEYEAKCVAKQ